MSIQDVNDELEKIKKIIITLEKYRPDETIGSLPVDIIAAIKQITIIDPLTSAGLERIRTVIKDLYFAKYALEQEINSHYTQSKAPPTPTQQDKTKKISPETSWQQNSAQQDKKGPQPKSSFGA